MLMPSVFVSHGSPMHAVHAGRAGELWADLGRRLPRPRAVVAASAHWETELPMVTRASQPATIHDFGGFPDELYAIRYPAPGAAELADRVVGLLASAGINATANGCRGLDHGAWVPLRRMYPAADVPIVQLSIQPSLDAAHHLRVGAALAPLSAEGVLVIGSGHITHNLHEWMSTARSRGSMAVAEGAAEEYVDAFRQWIFEALERGDKPALQRWRERAPYAVRAHPTPEHLLPLFVAYAAAGDGAAVERLDGGVDSGVLAMDAYVFSPRLVS
jgi:4,5-DOPA dioxygenase extradiol